MLPEAVISSHEQERKLFAAELGRVAEFAGLCENYAEAYRQIQGVLERYDLVHEFREKGADFVG